MIVLSKQKTGPGDQRTISPLDPWPGYSVFR